MASSAMPKLHFFTQADNQVPKKQKKAKKPQAAKEKYRLINWSEYNKALISRGLVTLWLSEDTLANWYYQGPRAPGGLFRYSDECIQAALALKAVFRLAFRQTQGLIQSILTTMKMTLQIPSYTQLCRRQAKVVAFSAPVPCEDNIIEALHLVIDSTGLKVYGEGDGAARAVEGQKARS